MGSGRNTPTIGEDGAYSVRPGSASSAGYEPATAEHDEVLVEQASVACSLAVMLACAHACVRAFVVTRHTYTADVNDSFYRTI